MRVSTHQPSFRVFLSSPGDVKAEREAAERVVRRIGGIYAAHVDIVLERWEGKFYQATAGFQEQIEATSAFDLVVGILWKRIGTELPPDHFRRLDDDTKFESGTALEIESFYGCAEYGVWRMEGQSDGNNYRSDRPSIEPAFLNKCLSARWR